MSSKAIIRLLKSSSFRFALLTGLVIWLTTSSVLVAVYFKVENTLWRSIEKNLDHSAELILNQAPKITESEMLAHHSEMLAQYSAGKNQTENSDKTSPDNSQPMNMHYQHMMGMMSPPGYILENNQTVTQNEGQLALTRNITLADGRSISVSENIDYLPQLKTNLSQSLIFGLVITFFVAVLGAIILTQRSLKRIHEINHACMTIKQGQFNHRIAYKYPSDRFDDYDKLALVINQMLDEINELVAKLHHAADNIAHDLKSPLARLRAHLETAYQQQPSATLEKGMAEVDRILAMIKSLLGLAHIEAHQKENFAPLDAAVITEDIIEMYQPAFEDKHIKLSSSIKPGTIYADAHLLFQALVNLFDNALKYTPEHGHVDINACVETPHKYKICIHDSGPGIAQAELDRVFERFYREDKARITEGFGLGLSLVKAIVKLHDGTIKLVNEQGLKATLCLPLVSIKSKD